MVTLDVRDAVAASQAALLYRRPIRPSAARMRSSSPGSDWRAVFSRGWKHVRAGIGMLIGIPMHPRQDSSNLDLLRSVAVLAVYGFHLAIAIGAKPNSQVGHFGVLVFFVHTSFVLMLSLARMEKNGQSLFGDFYLRRFFRIYPLSVVCVGLIVAFHLPRAPWWAWSNPGLGTIAANFLLCMNVFYLPPVTSVLWSLPYEVEMYLVLPVVYLIGRAKGWRGISLLWAVSVVVAVAQPHIAGRLDIAIYGPCFLAGVLAYFISSEVRGRPACWAWWPCAIVIAGSILAVFTVFHREVIGSWVMCLFLGGAYPFFEDLRVQWLKSLTHWIAQYSYGIYLTHLHAQWIAFVVLREAPAIVRVSVLVTLSIGLPVLSFHLVERPMTRLGSRLTQRRVLAGV
jgi:peptidoglycan/LPS O-acetylase OafA/YrhL